VFASLGFAAFWAVATIPLIVAATAKTRRSTKIGALLGLAGLFALTALAVTIAYAMNDDGAPLPLLVATFLLVTFMVTAFFSVRRRAA
jgi:hypothetical protein